MHADQFERLSAQGFNRIPLIREILADLETPLSTYLKLAQGPYSFLFESVQGGEKWGRYSIIGLPARTRLEVCGERIQVIHDQAVIETAQTADPLAWIEAYQQRIRAARPPGFPQMPRFLGGLAGYFGYDTVRYIEPRLKRCPNPDELGVPDMLFMVSDEVLVFDNLAGRLYLVVHVDPAEEGAYGRGEARLDELVNQLRNARSAYPVPRAPRELCEDDFRSNFEQAGFEEAVERIKRYVIDGDVMQVVPSQRMSAPYSAPPLDLYRALRCTNPSPYMYFLDLGDFQVAGSSPEILARLEDDEITVRPIAGTRRRGHTAEEDRALEQELLNDPKEIAEHLMLIDLGRNDIGRVSEVGSVQLTERMVVERYSHVMHIVSNVTGKLKPGLGPMDVLRATFPAGTVSGAPKIRAMEVIDEVEPVKRGVYAGAVGYLSWSGNMDTAIAIRTAVIKDGQVHVQAGAGVVADSVPRLEWKETLNKGRALFRAVAMAERGLDNREGA
ncbi:anthranilate synthase component I [Alkalilimnicola sp. S0819]|uniref:anthranilate synthase component I n=1 Tax=Alkalilimnicola sp. S0819 TaxID=2613922 RepID=UPI001261C0ED|nr:anthranilate synthase component I [Alkalilimnicola sp. S0819]KAB7628153.1 anthranilate synthase component I [Alkalilimnicola sp. S0819]MPQ15039.1 anthranilate synthase component I [Alkalilimnicola sp. S0819]